MSFCLSSKKSVEHDPTPKLETPRGHAGYRLRFCSQAIFSRSSSSMERIELCVHQSSALLQLRQFNRAGLVGIQKPRRLCVCQLDLGRQLLPLFAQASLFSIPAVNPALPIRF